MTWLHVPPSTSALATGDSSSPSDPWHGYEPWLTLSGTPTQRPSSWNGWARRAWIKLLSGMTSPPSTASRGVDEWISSLPVSPASRSAWQGSSEGLTMTAGSGRPSHPSSLTWNPSSSCWRTSPSLFDSGSPMSSTTLPTSGSMRNGVCSARQPLEHLTDVNASGSWPTPTTHDCKGQGFDNTNLHNATVRMWSTPVARDDQKSPEAHLRMKANMAGGPRIEVARDCKGSPSPKSTHVSLHKQVTRGHLIEETTSDGPDGSPKVDLNPFFVATLMGLPMDWLTLSTSAVTASCRRQLHTPSDSSSTVAGG